MLQLPHADLGPALLVAEGVVPLAVERPGAAGTCVAKSVTCYGCAASVALGKMSPDLRSPRDLSIDFTRIDLDALLIAIGASASRRSDLHLNYCDILFKRHYQRIDLHDFGTLK